MRGAVKKVGAPERPIADVIDLFGYRLLSDRSFGPWVREKILQELAELKWLRLAAVVVARTIR